MNTIKKNLQRFLVVSHIVTLGACTFSEDKNITFSDKSVFDELSSANTASVSPAPAKPEMPAGVMNKLNSRHDEHYGIDVSHFQGDLVELLTVNKDSLKFIICKATQGTGYVDPMFRTNWNEIQKRGFIRGAYHFYDCSKEPKAQARHFVSMISDITDYDIAPILDIEQGSLVKGINSQEVEKQALIFLQEVERLINRKPIIYSDYGFFQQYITNPTFAQYNLWLAEYSGSIAPSIPTVWKEKSYLIWQRSDNYHTKSTQTDFDVVKGLLQKIVQK